MKTFLFRIASVFALSSIAFCSTGCASSPMMQGFRGIMRSLTPNDGYYSNVADEEDEAWVKNVGVEGRGDQEMTVETDPVRKWWLSTRAKGIERNLGVIGTE